MNKKELEKLWEDFGNIPLDGNTDDIDIGFIHFEKGTSRFEVWSWFEDQGMIIGKYQNGDNDWYQTE